MYDDDFPTFECPNCGTEVSLRAAACPECGSDSETGWSEEAKYNHLFDPNLGHDRASGHRSSDFDSDYDEADRDEARSGPAGMPLWQKIVSVFLAYLLASPLVTLFEPSSRGFMLLTTILAIAIAYLVVVHRMGGNFNSLFNRPPSPTYSRLLRRARGDKALVERLIQYEQERNQNGSRQEWERDALLRWERDR